MKNPVVIIGIGELAGVLARGFLRDGFPVFPVTRDMDASEEAIGLPEPEMVVVAVAENDFPDMMAKMPAAWRTRLVLLKNELLPEDWKTLGIENPTVMSVWFEKKKGMDYKPFRPTPIFGPYAETVASALGTLEIPAQIVRSEQELLFELVLKNVFVLTINIAGLVLPEGSTTEDLWADHQDLAKRIAGDVIAIQETITGQSFNHADLIDGLKVGILADPNHKCRGRSAPGRLERALRDADANGVECPTIQEIDHQLKNREAVA
ncbi:hypothetical protein [Aliiruegeria sabulilitoris]|uniref:hypothetical protein n=1 Tax=Aliiruegeria sabulilitoris TaxID=1510458 RepID=UPI00082D581C|nr:hypothetical protein [Aliiruegeria sabulilitoris]NDR55428.1 hypothetical protein [Pseudoruegeria sp. M32A2M]